jgi:hypothetical protein
MADKPATVKRERVGQKIGRLGNQDMARVGIALAFVLRASGLAMLSVASTEGRYRAAPTPRCGNSAAWQRYRVKS